MTRVARPFPSLAAPLLAAALISGPTGCQDYRFEQVCSESIKEADVNIAAAEPTPADILFVVDNSGSMADEQENLARNFEFFINEIAGAGDYRIAVVTTDQFYMMEREGLATFSFSSSFPYNLLSVSNAACSNTDIPMGCFRAPEETSRIIDSSTMDRDTQISLFQQNVRVGSCGAGSETGMKAMLSALTQAQSGCNQGFLRDNANLVVIFVTDEEDADDAPIQQYVEDLAQFKSYSQIRLAAIVGSVDGEPSSCSVNEGRDCGSMCGRLDEINKGSGQPCTPGQPGQCPMGEACKPETNECASPDYLYWNDLFCGWCSYYNAPDCCSALAGSRYINFVRAVEARINTSDPTIPVSGCRPAPGARAACLIDSICQADFGQTLARIARELVITNQYNLNPPALYPPGVKVKITGGRFGADGVELKFGDDFTISEDGRILNILGDKTPMEGEDVQISYVTARDDSTSMPRGACGI